MANDKREVIIYDLIIDGNVVFTGTADEIAEKLGISSVTVYTRHRKGKHILQEKRKGNLLKILAGITEPSKIGN